VYLERRKILKWGVTRGALGGSSATHSQKKKKTEEDIKGKKGGFGRGGVNWQGGGGDRSGI